MRRQSTAKTPEAREQELIALATNMAEQQLRDGTAPAPLVNMLVRSGQKRSRLEEQQKEEEIKLLRARVAELERASQTDEKLDKVLNAMRKYKGEAEPEEYESYA